MLQPGAFNTGFNWFQVQTRRFRHGFLLVSSAETKRFQHGFILVSSAVTRRFQHEFDLVSTWIPTGYNLHRPTECECVIDIAPSRGLVCSTARTQGLTLVPFSAQRVHFFVGYTRPLVGLT